MAFENLRKVINETRKRTVSYMDGLYDADGEMIDEGFFIFADGRLVMKFKDFQDFKSFLNDLEQIRRELEGDD